MNVTYVKHKSSSKYFIEINGIRIVSCICNELNITLQEYINVLQINGAKISNKWGWYLPTEEKAMNCCVMLNLLKK